MTIAVDEKKRWQCLIYPRRVTDTLNELPFKLVILPYLELSLLFRVLSLSLLREVLLVFRELLLLFRDFARGSGG